MAINLLFIYFFQENLSCKLSPKQDLTLRMANPVSGENEKNISKCRLLKKKKKINKIKQEGKGLAYSIYKEKPSFFKMSFLTPYKYELLINNIAVSHTHIHA